MEKVVWNIFLAVINIYVKCVSKMVCIGWKVDIYPKSLSFKFPIPYSFIDPFKLAPWIRSNKPLTVSFDKTYSKILYLDNNNI